MSEGIVASTSGGVVFAFIILVVPAAIYFGALAAKKRRERYAQLAAHLGMQLDFEDVVGIRESGFGLFDDGHSRKVVALLRGDDDGPGAGQLRCAFEYRYTTGSGDSEQVHRFLGAMLNVSARVPRMNIGREVLGGKLLGAIGMRDIEVESGEFNAAFRVKGEDEKLAFAVLDGALQEWLLAQQIVDWRNIELLGEHLLVVRSGNDIEMIPKVLDFAKQFRDRIPDVVSSMYPAAHAVTPPQPPLPPTQNPGAN
ncbi:MAG: hypothetical protein WBD02_00705 [Acidimicrobiia bacterium]